MMRRRSCLVPAVPSSAFKGFRFPPEIIVLAVRWYLRYGLSYRDVEELLAERGIEVDHVTVYRWVQRFTPLLADAARPCRHAVGDRWFVDETYVKVAGRWRYVYRAIDQYGQIIDVYVSAKRDIRAARWFFTTALGAHGDPVEIVTDRAPALLAVVEELMPARFTTRSSTRTTGSNATTADSRRDSVRCADSNATIRREVMRGHAFMQNIRRGHYELGIDAGPSARRCRIHRTRPSHLTRHGPGPPLSPTRPRPTQRNRALLSNQIEPRFFISAPPYLEFLIFPPNKPERPTPTSYLPLISGLGEAFSWRYI